LPILLLILLILGVYLGILLLCEAFYACGRLYSCGGLYPAELLFNRNDNLLPCGALFYLIGNPFRLAAGLYFIVVAASKASPRISCTQLSWLQYILLFE
jgi:hypothetical protein